MRNLIIGLAALFSVQASATSLVPARDMVQINGLYNGKPYIAEVNNYGVLEVTRQGKRLAIKQLSSASFEQIYELAQSLASVTVKTTRHQIVCMMMPSGTRVDALSVSTLESRSLLFSGRLRVVLGPEGCWAPSHTFPVEEFARSNAQTLKKVLEVLAAEVADLE